MEGLIGHLHLFAYFLVLISVLKAGRDWRWFFYVLAGSGAAMAFYGWLQYFGAAAISSQSGPRVDGTFGNASYLAIFMVFQAFLAFYFFLKSRQNWLKIIFAALFILEAPIIIFTSTRGAILGFLGGLFLSALFLIIFSENKRVKTAAIAAAGAIILFVGLFWIFKDSDFIRNNYILVRFSDISFQEGTVESRFTIWKMSFKGFKEHPILGWGIENYNLVFNKYYDPVMWKQEPWFDRSHNVIFDWLISSGLFGLLAYLGIFASTLYILWRKYVKDSMFSAEAIVFTGLFAAYFFHNLFVFDNLISYYMFFSILGFIHFQFQESQDEKNININENISKEVSLGLGQMLGIFAVFIVLLFSLYFANLKPVLANRALLDTLKDISIKGQDADAILKDFDKVFAYQTFGTGEAREQLSGYTNDIIKINLPNEVKIKVVNKSIEEMLKQVAENPEDARGYIFLSALYSDVGKQNEALAVLNKALELSPKKQQIYFLAADVYMALNQNDKAMKAMQLAYDFDQNNTAAAEGLAITAIVAGKPEYAEELLLKHFNAVIIGDQKFVNAYARVGNFARVKDIWLLIIEKEPNNAQYRVNLAATYLQLNERTKAVKELEKAIELNPDFKGQGEYFIKEIKAGRNP
ncbi:MAG: O-antigen ligase family protein [Candidatus Niyogibacteria bacterium]|nr:O-antigen ligase family protein [Candidatus Niyogibacteria bacterium]